MTWIWIIFLLPFCKAYTPPNILVVVADDLGYNDVSWHNPDIQTPWIDKLISTGVILENHYVQQMCTPTRATLMTSYYPIHTGRQHDVIRSQEPTGLYTNFTLMPQRFKDIGYRTHMVGKWHLGYCDENYLPQNRGFDTFYGFLAGAEDYYTHDTSPTEEDGGGPPGYDFYDQDVPDYTANGTYSSFAFGFRVVDILEDHVANHSDKPFFIYLPFQDVHGPLQVPIQYEEMYPEINNTDRRVFSGMVSALDDALGLVLRELHDRELLENTIIVFLSDNGGQTAKGGNNYPLRGNKDTLWEGGTRSTSFISSSLLRRQGIVNHGLFHVVDWTPTLLSAIKAYVDQPGKEYIEKVLLETDGVDQWRMLANGEPSGRTEFLYNYDPIWDRSSDNTTISAGIRVGEMKLILGDPGKPDGWIPPDSFNEKFEDDTNYGNKKMFKINGLEVNLFNITADPFEHNNIAEDNPTIVDELMDKLEEYKKTMIPPNVEPETEKGNPKYFNGTYAPGWCESKPKLNIV